MIAIETLDLAARTAGLRRLGAPSTEDAAAVERLRLALRRLGIDHVQGLEVRGATPDPGSGGAAAPIATLHSVALRHRFVLEGSVPVYAARCPHRREALGTLGLWADAVLDTLGVVQGPLHHARLALYELCANALEHGRPLRADAEIAVVLQLEPSAVVCHLRDQCERFDPAAPRDRSLAEHVAGRPTRGYGLHLVRRLVGGLSHHWDGAGNAIDFRKDLRS